MDKHNDLFRITTTGEFDGKPLKHVYFRVTKDGAREYAEDCERRGRKVVSIEHFRRVKESECSHEGE